MFLILPTHPRYRYRSFIQMGSGTKYKLKRVPKQTLLEGLDGLELDGLSSTTKVSLFENTSHSLPTLTTLNSRPKPALVPYCFTTRRAELSRLSTQIIPGQRRCSIHGSRR